MSTRYGVAGRIASLFLGSPLTPLFIVAAVLAGALAVIALPREEEPQIAVPMIDVTVQLPGAEPSEVEQRISRPLEQLLWEIPGVEYIYSTSSAGEALVIVRFRVGEDEGTALDRVDHKINANLDRVPPGASAPLVRPRSIDDVPVMALTFWGEGWDDYRLRQVAGTVAEGLKQLADVSELTLLGGRPRQVTVSLDPGRLSAHNVDVSRLRDALAAGNARQRAGELVHSGEATIVDAGAWASRLDDIGRTRIGAGPGSILLRDIAKISDGPADPVSYVTYRERNGAVHPAVTLAIAKRRGANAITLTRAIEARLDVMRGVLVPQDVHVSIVRNYGETAADKSNELLWHMCLAVLSVSALILLALGVREALVVLIAIPVTLALTLFIFYLYGYTLNRITLFALIFSIGILVDDAIVVVENVARHAREAHTVERGLSSVAVRAVDEVGNPTILATLTVIAAILPMAFVGGLMGPYMRPIPVGASAAMLFSLIVAFVVTPWAVVRIMRVHRAHADASDDRLTRLYRRAMSQVLKTTGSQLAFLGGVALLLSGSIALVPLGLVTVKMLPFDNKSEFQVLVNMPEGTALEDTARVASALADTALEEKEVRSIQTYSGTASPYNFNGLVRHYYLRRASNQADLQINLAPKSERSVQSHAVALAMRRRLAPLAERLGARIQVSEVPPGPPVLQTLVAEVYGPNPSRRIELAREVKDLLQRTPGVVDVDWYVEAPRSRLELQVDRDRSAAAGITPAQVAAAARMAAGGESVGLLHDPVAREEVPIVLRLPRDDRRGVEQLGALHLVGTSGTPSLATLVTPRTTTLPPSLYHKNLLPVTYVIGDVAGGSESPVYAILRMNDALARMRLPEGYSFEVFSTRQPDDPTRYAMKWDGEWHITYEVFRDLGLAFAAVLVLIYVLVVGWFRSFVTPLVIMAAIPFSLVGILPAHAAMGAFFTATSMIGFIAGAGIVVRNSIILVDFIEMRLAGGMAFGDAVIDAGAVRFRPMALTAAAVIAGSAVILFDPIFQGLALSLMAGEVASLLLSRAAVPVLYHLTGVRTRVTSAREGATV